MKKVFFILISFTIFFSSCYEDAKPTLALNFIIDGEYSQSRSVTNLVSTIESLHIAVYHSSNLDVPVSVGSAYKKSAGEITTVNMAVPLGQVAIVVWGANSSNEATYFSNPVIAEMVEGNNDVSVTLLSFAPMAYQFVITFNSTYYSWTRVYGATSYTFTGNGEVYNVGLNNYITTGGTVTSPRVIVKSEIFGIETVSLYLY